MKPKVILLAVLTLLFICTIAFAQQEQITLSTYYPAPYGEYDELSAEKVLVWRPDAAEFSFMNEGDCHIGYSLIVGTGGDGFSYDELNAAMTPLDDGDVIIKGYVGIGTTNPSAGFHLHEDAWDTDVYIGNPPQTVHGHVSADAAGIFISSDTNYGPPGGYGGHVFFINKETGKTWHMGVGNDDSFRITETGIANSMNFLPGGNVGIGTKSPLYNLHVKLGSGQGQIGIGPRGAIRLENSAFSTDASIRNESTTGESYLAFHTHTGGGTGERVRITGSGDVGIGTDNPQANLHVEGDTRITGEAIIGGGLKPDYDSGWFFINASGSQTHTLNHNLGSIPTRMAMYVSNSNNPTWVQPCNFLSRGIGYNSPENLWMSNTQVIVNICWADVAIYVDANNPAPPGSGIVTSETGYMRVLLWI